jgi:twitching motility protein PilT
MKSIHELLELALKARASDLVLKAGARPAMRIDGKMTNLDLPPLTPRDTREFAYSILFSAARDHLLQYPQDDAMEEEESRDDAEASMRELRARKELDIVFTIPKLARIRANLFLERGTIGAALRVIPLSPYTIDELSLPPVLKEMAMQPQGLVVITGPTGSGKTTTMAAFIEEINRRRPANIYTIEEPIEYVFTDRKSVVHQREVGTDTDSFASALRSVTRQTPDVIAIGEMRDAETMDVAMTAAEIGHLVVTTLHTTSAPATVDRILNSFPQHLKRQVSAQLAASLLCVTSQRLVHRVNGIGRIPAVEVMTNSPTVRKGIEESDDASGADLYTSMREGVHFGMNTMNQALEKLYQSKQISYDEAMLYAGNLAELKQMLRRT